MSGGDTFATQTGRFYELLVKAGAVRAMIDHGEEYGAGGRAGYDRAFRRLFEQKDTLIDEFGRYRIDEIIPQILGLHAPTEDVHKAVARYLEILAKQAMLAGYSTVRRYLSRLRRAEGRCGIEELLHLQCAVSGEFGTPSTGIERACQSIRALTGRPVFPQRWREPGEFLNADFLALFRTDQGLSLLVLEMSAALPVDFASMPNVEIGADIIDQMTGDIGHMVRKSVFTPAVFEMGDLGFELSAGIAEHFKAFSSADKEPSKVIQGCSYVESFLSMLEEADAGSPIAALGEGWRTGWEVNVVAITNRTVEVINTQPATRPVLAASRSVYPALRRAGPPVDLRVRRRRLADELARVAQQSFDVPNAVLTIDGLIAATPERPLVIEEEVHGLRNPSGQVTQADLEAWLGAEMAEKVRGADNLRAAHTALILEALKREEGRIILAGHPGIGKTYSIRQYLKGLQGGYLFFYFSPRVIVNEGLIQEFVQDVGGTGVAMINTDSHVVATGMRWLPQEPLRSVILQGPDPALMPRGSDLAYLSPAEYNGLAMLGQREGARSPVVMQSETLMAQSKKRPHGVLNSLTFAARSLIDAGHTRVVAASSIQALRMGDRGSRTTDAFARNLFRGSLVKDRPTLEGLRDLAAKCPTIVIAIDEITGDSAGAELHSEMRKLLFDTFQRPFLDAQEACPFRLKLIIADASLNNRRIAMQYLRDREPNADRIYVERIGEADHDAVQPLSFQAVSRDTLFINANAYPSADPLRIRYHMLINKIPEGADRKEMYESMLGATAYMQRLGEGYLSRPDHEQTIIYIQDKNRIADLEGAFERQIGREQILLCHANLSRRERMQIDTRKQTANLVLMTSSGARGISFPRTDTLILEVPGFALEQNVMEIIQAIYRGRGPGGADRKPRTIDFVFARNIFVPDGADEDTREAMLQAQALAIVNLLMIVRTSVHTRLRGFGHVGGRKIAMIPVGGKSVEGTAQSFSRHISELEQGLRKAIPLLGSNPQLRGACVTLREELPSVFKDANYNIGELGRHQADGLLSQPMREVFSRNFNETLKIGLGGLIGLAPFPKRAIALGAMLIEPIAGSDIRESIRFQTWDGRATAQIGRLRKILENINREEVPSNLRGCIDDIEAWLKKLRDYPHEVEFQDPISSSMRFLAVPVAGYDRAEEMARFIPDTEEFPTRDVMVRYVTQHARPGDVLPRLSHEAYHEPGAFPFLCFTNPYLESIENKLFSKHHVAATPEFNLMNLLMLTDPVLVHEVQRPIG